MSVNVESLSREELEQAVISQVAQLRVLSDQVQYLKKANKNLEDQYDAVSNVLLHLRIVLNSGLTPE